MAGSREHFHHGWMFESDAVAVALVDIDKQFGLAR